MYPLEEEVFACIKHPGGLRIFYPKSKAIGDILKTRQLPCADFMGTNALILLFSKISGFSLVV
jgi:hypothetical protein